jgi:glycosyltransferase involved in cell wall biosynthesis
VGFDIGIATLFNHEMHRSKSAFKAKQYLNNGIPVLSSDIKENNRFVKHGKNGFLCETPGDFRNRIIEISQMSDNEYKTMSDEAISSKPDFSLDKYCTCLMELFSKSDADSVRN